MFSLVAGENSGHPPAHKRGSAQSFVNIFQRLVHLQVCLPTHQPNNDHVAQPSPYLHVPRIKRFVAKINAQHQILLGVLMPQTKRPSNQTCFLMGVEGKSHIQQVLRVMFFGF